MSSNSDSQSVGSKDFAAILAEQFRDSDSALAGALSDADKKKELIMNLGMMMCQSGGLGAIMMSLLFALPLASITLTVTRIDAHMMDLSPTSFGALTIYGVKTEASGRSPCTQGLVPTHWLRSKRAP